jgi:hypothetical protein
MWPRRKNTRGPENEDEEGVSDSSAVEDKESDLETATTGAERNRKDEQRLHTLGKQDSLEAKMAEEGMKLLAAEGRQPHSQDHTSDGPRKRATVSKKNSTEDLRMPGRFQ